MAPLNEIGVAPEVKFEEGKEPLAQLPQFGNSNAFAESLVSASLEQHVEGEQGILSNDDDAPTRLMDGFRVSHEHLLPFHGLRCDSLIWWRSPLSVCRKRKDLRTKHH